MERVKRKDGKMRTIALEDVTFFFRLASFCTDVEFRIYLIIQIFSDVLV